MSNKPDRREFAKWVAGIGLAMGLAPAGLPQKQAKVAPTVDVETGDVAE